MSGEEAVEVVLMPELLFASDHISIEWFRRKASGIYDESIVLVGHCSMLVGVGKGATILH
jgi:hypothetical protein